jgi:hypothetical protein
MVKALLLTHGMGVHGADWATDAITGIKNAADSFGLGDPFSETITDGKVALIPITYDEHFTDLLDFWGHDARELSHFITDNSISVPSNLIGWLDKADETENNFLWTHVIDVILYRYFSEVTTNVRVHIMEAVAKVWAEALAADTTARVSVMAHSLGTSVMHDSLALLGTKPPPGCEGFLAGDRRLSNIFMVANVSRILETSPQAFASIIAPPSVRGSTAYCANMFNVHHELDPFVAPRRFKPTWGGSDYVDIETTAVREFNTHSFERYIDDPRLHVPLLRSLLGFDAISNKDAADAIAAYEKAPGPACPQALADFLKDCRQRIHLIEDSSDVKTLIAAGVHFLADVEEVREKCKK